MSEILIGTGHQKSIRALAAMADAHLAETHGAPRRLKVHAGHIEIIADRQDYRGEFVRYLIRGRFDPDTVAALEAAVAQRTEACTLHEEDGWHVLQCPPPDVELTPEIGAAFDEAAAGLTLPQVWRAFGEDYREDPVDINLLFQAVLQYRASDIHLCPGQTPIFRVDGQPHHSELLGPLSAGQILTLVRQIAPENYWAEFERTKQTSFSFHQIGISHARVSAFLKSGVPHCTFRYLPETVPSFEELNLPPETMASLGNLHSGLLLVTGMSGSGKTTTAAALIDYINANMTSHIVTVEDPVEYFHANKKSIISQRTLGADVNSFKDAVLGVMRHDPDVIFLGEMRDSDTIRAAIDAAATGHLVISTLHSNTASDVVARISSFFDPNERDLIRLQLRDCLKCVMCQRLVPRVGGGRIVALEIMYNDIKPLSVAIIEGDTDGIRIGMQQTVSHSFLFEEFLYRLYKSGKIDIQHAQQYATDRGAFDQMRMGTYSVPRLESLKAARDASQRG